MIVRTAHLRIPAIPAAVRKGSRNSSSHDVARIRHLLLLLLVVAVLVIGRGILLRQLEDGMIATMLALLLPLPLVPLFGIRR